MIAVDPHAQGILELLATATMPDGAPVRIGDAVAPKSSDGTIVAPCAILHLRAGGEVSGSLGCLDTDAILRFQVTAVGRTAREARTVADAITATFDAQVIAVDGREVVRVGRPPSAGPVMSPQRDDDVKPPLFYVPVEYRLWTVPADGS